MKLFLLTALTVACIGNVAGQTFFDMTYPVSFPMGDLKDYSSSTSFRGFNMEIMHDARPGVAAGIETGWHVFYDRIGKADYKKDNITISGVQFRTTNSVPLLAVAKIFRPEDEGKAGMPYVGLGIGTLYVSRATDFGLYRIYTDAWQFCLRPEVGVLFNMQPGMRVMVGAKYYAAFNTSDLDGQSFLSANVGIFWGL